MIPLILEDATKLGYTLVEENEYAYLFDYKDITGTYGLIPQYENVCIGNAAEYISYLYPSFYKLSDDYLDDYKGLLLDIQTVRVSCIGDGHHYSRRQVVDYLPETAPTTRSDKNAIWCDMVPERNENISGMITIINESAA